jgi:hypothetical protein
MASNKEHCLAVTGGSRVVAFSRDYCGCRVSDGTVVAGMWHHNSARAGIEDEGCMA